MGYPVIVGHDPDEVARDEYCSVESWSAKEAARIELQRQFDKGYRYNPGTYNVTVLVYGEPETFEVAARPRVKCYLA